MFQSVLIIWASIGIPLVLLVGTMVSLKWLRRRENKRSPLTDKLFHQPGEQLRRRIGKLDDDIQERLVRLFVIGPLMLLALVLPSVNWSAVNFGWGEATLLAIASVFIAWNIRSFSRLWKERIQAQSGLSGELASAQELNRLQGKGCVVFHDLPGEKGNIDHIVVAPNAVFAVETKWRSKKGKGKASAEVLYDGKSLQFPGGFRDESPLEQARACARELSKYLHGRTGEPVRVIPVVALPGWFVKPTPGAEAAEVKVLNPKLVWMLLKIPGTPISPQQSNRIVDRIAERYPELRD
jgi:membrane protein implicated in regulation of membrane protease activity